MKKTSRIPNKTPERGLLNPFHKTITESEQFDRFMKEAFMRNFLKKA